jgi:hypothetical protein
VHLFVYTDLKCLHSYADHTVPISKQIIIMGTGGSFPGGKARPGRDADHSPPSSAEVKNEKELYLLSPPPSQLACSGQLYFFFFYFLKCGLVAFG